MYVLIDSFAQVFLIVNMPVRITRQNYYNCARRMGDKKGIFSFRVAKNGSFLQNFIKIC